MVTGYAFPNFLLHLNWEKRSLSPFFTESHPCESGEKLLPGPSLRRENAFPGDGQLVIAPSPLPGLLDPLPLDPTALLHPIKQRIERGGVKLQNAIGSIPDESRDFVTVSRPLLYHGQDQQFGAASLEFTVEH